MTLLASVSLPGTPACALDVAVPWVHGDYLQGKGYSGSGVEIGVIDAYLADGSHPAISGNYLGFEKVVPGPSLTGFHATEVVGAAVSQDPVYTGVAPGAGWWTVQTATRQMKTSLPYQTTAGEMLAQGLGNLQGNPVEVITMSIGTSGLSNAMDQWSLALDHIAGANGKVITVAAGNGGPGAGTVTGLPPGAYNVITVGATGGSGQYISEDYSQLAVYSSRGPTADGRCKPDIVAPGSLVHLPSLQGGWADVSGTSFATPLVAGGAAALIGMGLDLGYSVDPKIIKSVLLNSAEKLPGWYAQPTRPLDLAQGAGQMNLEKAYRQYLPGEQGPGTVRSVGWDIGEVPWDGQSLYGINMDVPAGQIISATLAWDRAVSTNSEDIEKVVYTLDHLYNLDLYLYEAEDLTAPVAMSVSLVDNVEHVYCAAPETGRYVIGVDMAGAAAGEDETYGLSWHLLPELFRQPGDANLDDAVDMADLGLLAGNWQHLVTGGPNDADFNTNGLVDFGDLTVLAANWGWSKPLGGAPVPEPATLSLLVVGGLVMPRLRTSVRHIR